jgi:N-acetylmuramoyl-L-alanine amidase
MQTRNLVKQIKIISLFKLLTLMQIKNHLIEAQVGEQPIVIKPTPNVVKSASFKPTYLIIHFTAGRNAESSVNWLTNPDAKASVHLVIGRDGKIYQLAPFNVITWHAGASNWMGLDGLNQHSIGIELDNAGRLEKQGNTWLSWFKGQYNAEDVLVAKHKHWDKEEGWHEYTEAQIESCLEVSKLIVKEYKLQDVLGHDDIAPYRKVDPGPAFPMENFRSQLFGRSEDMSNTYTIQVDNTNLRPSAGTTMSPITKLKKGTSVNILHTYKEWLYVTVLGTVNDDIKEGWVHSSLVK